jgi:predicted membrane-bound spermidine synthase
MFEEMHKIVKEGKCGVAEISHFEVDKDASRWSMLRAAMGREGKYVKLKINGSLYMSDTQMEKRSNTGFVRSANGKVLIAGLGIGLIIAPLLKRENVTQITVIEKYQDVIDLVAPNFQSDKLEIICADILEWKPAKGEKFDSIYFDIWKDVCTDNLEEINLLHRRFKSKLNRENPEAFMDSWKVEELRYQKRRENRNRYW